MIYRHISSQPVIDINMINYIWTAMVLLSIVCAVFNGNMGDMTGAIFGGASDAVSVCVKMLGTLCLWCGLMNIAEKSGLCDMFARILSPLIDFLFPKLKKEREIKNAIAMNMTANLFGLGNAATPLGINAMRKLQDINGDKSTASYEMMVFTVINTAALRIVPSTVAGLRAEAGAGDPMDIIFCVWISSLLSLIAAVSSVKLIRKLLKK